MEGDPHQDGYYLTSLWASASSGGVTINSILKIWDAKNVKEGMNLLGKIETSWNLLMADKDGNIGYQMSGLMPKRREGVSGFVPLPGWKKENDWQGFEKPEDLPRCYNPECGYFVTSNQDLNEYGNVNPINIGMGPYRSDRIADLLSGPDNFTCDDMMKIQ
ncbi:MAG: penicillin acylase family protein, partial [Deltaproteobacteria bacterium]|nr:penicillin acylase family protein [Deltaproteobacteria bacterium]